MKILSLKLISISTITTLVFLSACCGSSSDCYFPITEPVLKINFEGFNNYNVNYEVKCYRNNDSVLVKSEKETSYDNIARISFKFPTSAEGKLLDSYFLVLETEHENGIIRDTLRDFQFKSGTFEWGCDDTPCYWGRNKNKKTNTYDYYSDFSFVYDSTRETDSEITIKKP
ncbi:MAG: hypothetical protein MUF42_15205 [Cytophagaceae bacterium]|jgi:hypothetical protein|nr:hypothetical protein [Cytophagaceae bacterium]